MHHVAAAEAGVAGEHDTRLPVLGGHGLAAQAGEALQPAAPHQGPVYERLLGQIHPVNFLPI